MKYVIATLLAIGALHANAQQATTPELKLTIISINEEGENLLADTKGNTLYVFDLDQSQKVPACTAKCSEIWPPYLLTADEVGQLKAPYGAISRENKNVQLTYEGRPVYAYAYDRGAAADAGDGIGGVWHYIEIKK